ncbi:MAG: TetR/AcrR family transcriptional regulator [Labilithrix sp.]|nr:TetR/AcrR family transcriptional regulator [Labilithrix sp.]
MTTAERRRAILDCAARLFRHYGHAKTTIADIAREAEVGVGTVYLEFPSKEAIVEELSSSTHVRVLDAMRRVADARSGESFSERLTGVLEARVATFQKLASEGQHACELVHCKTDTVKAVHARFREEERALFQMLLDQARASYEIASVDTARAAALIQRAYATLSPPWLFEERPEEGARLAREMGRLLLLGLMSRTDPDADDERPPAPAPKRAARTLARRRRSRSSR